jgi:uncharacterized membrane protein YkvI
VTATSDSRARRLVVDVARYGHPAGRVIVGVVILVGYALWVAVKAVVRNRRPLLTIVVNSLAALLALILVLVLYAMVIGTAMEMVGGAP